MLSQCYDQRVRGRKYDQHVRQLHEEEENTKRLELVRKIRKLAQKALISAQNVDTESAWISDIPYPTSDHIGCLLLEQIESAYSMSP